ncbi:MAG: hypothetical protein ACI9LM_003111 [Alteromonadaceae bacterium]|jgi:uncharacterized protein (DUF2141 family)
MNFKQFTSYSAISLLMSVLGALAMIVMLSQSVHAADLTINISEVESGKGAVMVALYAGEAAYKSGKATFVSQVTAVTEKESVTFKDLVDGEYAVKIYQDENSNDALDFNMLGIPKEGYGFSNNVGRFGQPDYKEAKFTVQENTVIEMELF